MEKDKRFIPRASHAVTCSTLLKYLKSALRSLMDNQIIVCWSIVAVFVMIPTRKRILIVIKFVLVCI